MQRIRARLLGASGDRDGGSMLVELMVALVVFGVMATGLVSLSMSLIKLTGTNRARSVAAGLAAKDLDIARAIGPTNLALNRTTLSSVTIGGTTYSIYRDVAPYAPGNTGCSVGVETSRRVTTTVKWVNRSDPTHATSTPVTASTILTASPGSFDQGTGSLSVSVVDRNNNALSGVPVYLVTGTGTTGGTAATTTDEGCASYDQLTPGTYTAYLGNSPAYVVPGYIPGSTPTPPSSTQSVTAGNSSNVSFQYDKAASVTLSVNTNATYPVPANIPFTIYNSSFVGTPTVYSTTWTLATGTQTMFSPGNGTYSLSANSYPALFPSTSGYQPWAGDCTDADPGSASGNRGDVVTTLAGASAGGTAKVVPIDLTMNGLTASKSLSITATHTATTGVTCANPAEKYTLAPSTTTAGTTTGTTQKVSFALPYGHWTIAAQCNGKTAVSQNVNYTGTTAPWPATAQALTMAMTC